MEIKKMHVGVYGVVINDDKIVLIKKARGGYKGKLDLPGGGIEHFEVPNETLIRELIEEVGVMATEYNLLDVTAVNIKWEMEKDLWENLHHVGILYNVCINSKDVKKDADGLDSNGADWYFIDDLSKDNLTPFAIYGLEKMGYKLTK